MADKTNQDTPPLARFVVRAISLDILKRRTGLTPSQTLERIDIEEYLGERDRAHSEASEFGPIQP